MRRGAAHPIRRVQTGQTGQMYAAVGTSQTLGMIHTAGGVGRVCARALKGRKGRR